MSSNTGNFVMLGIGVVLIVVIVAGPIIANLILRREFVRKHGPFNKDT